MHLTIISKSGSHIRHLRKDTTLKTNGQIRLGGGNFADIIKRWAEVTRHK